MGAETNIKEHNIERYKSAVNRVDYVAISTDLDGTAIRKGNNIDKQELDRLSFLIRSGVDILLNTGRGQGSTDSICDSLGRTLPINQQQEVYVANYNGALIQRYIIDSNGVLNSEFIAEFPLIDSEIIFEKIINNAKWASDLILPLPNIANAKPKFASKARYHGITLAFEEGKQLPLISEVEQFLASQGYDSDKVKVLFSGKTYDIVSADAGKDNAVNLFSKVIHADPNTVLRIGDQGNAVGQNDYDMLNNSSGFLVGEKQNSERIDVAHLVVDSEGNILYGVDGFKAVLKDANLHAKIVLPAAMFQQDDIDSNEVLKRYHELANKARIKFENLNNSFAEESVECNNVVKEDDVNSEIFQTLFTFNGAIRLSQSEMESIPEGELKNFLFTYSQSYGNGEEPRYKHIMKYGDGTEFYGRAESFYSTMKGTEDDKIAGNVEERFLATTTITKELIDHYPRIAYRLQEGNLSLAEWKASLIYLDHLKSSALHLFHSYSYLGTLGFLGTYDEFTIKNEEMRNFASACVKSYYKLLGMLKPKDIIINSNFIDQCANEIDVVIKNSDVSNRKVIAKSVRGISEADHPLFNMIYAISAARTIDMDSSNAVTFMALHFGGIELPYVVEQEMNRRYPNTPVEAIVSIHYSKYSNKYLNVKDPHDIMSYCDRKEDYTGKTIVLFDDGILTGGSLEKIATIVSKKGARVLFSVQSIGNGRRFGQMMKGGGINPDFIAKELPDIIKVTPIARADNPDTFEMQAKLGRFNLVKRRTRKMLKDVYEEGLAIKDDEFKRLRK